MSGSNNSWELTGRSARPVAPLRRWTMSILARILVSGLLAGNASAGEPAVPGNYVSLGATNLVALTQVVNTDFRILIPCGWKLETNTVVVGVSVQDGRSMPIVGSFAGSRLNIQQLSCFSWAGG